MSVSTGSGSEAPGRPGPAGPATSGEPEGRLAPEAKRLWRLTAGLSIVPALLAGSWLGGVLSRSGAGGALPWLPLVLALVAVVIAVALLPGLRYRRWRYEIRSDEIDIRHGALAIRRTLVPMTRVQHVETRTGPLQSLFGLATVVFHTAAGENAIPQLREPEAGEVRWRVASLARTSTDEV